MSELGWVPSASKQTGVEVRVPIRVGSSWAFWQAAGLAVIVGFVTGIIASPLTTVLVLGAVATLALLTNPLGRALLYVVGGLIVLNSDSGITPAKLTYLAVVVVAVGVAMHRLHQARSEPWLQPFRPLLHAVWLLFVLIGVAALVGSRATASPQGIARDAVTYLLIAGAAPVALDASSGISPRGARRLTVLFGVLGAAGFAVALLHGRGVSALGVDRILLPTFVLPVLGLCVAASLALALRQFRWLPAVIVIPALTLVTGTRTDLVVVVSLVATFGSRHKIRASIVSGGMILLGVVTAVVLAVPLLVVFTSTDPYFLTDRFKLLQQFLSGAADPSYLQRAFAYRFTRQLFDGSPVFGVGLGHLFPDPQTGQIGTSYYLDSPLLFLAKFGLFGLALGVLVIVGFIRSFIAVRDAYGWDVTGTAARAFGWTMLALLPFGAPTEEKGFALAVLLLVLMFGARARAGQLLEAGGRIAVSERDAGP